MNTGTGIPVEEPRLQEKEDAGLARVPFLDRELRKKKRPWNPIGRYDMCYRRWQRQEKRCRLLCVTLLCALLTGLGEAGRAEEGFSGSLASAVLMDAGSGEILLESNGHGQHQPASIVKMMVAFIVMTAVVIVMALFLRESAMIRREAAQGRPGPSSANRP